MSARICPACGGSDSHEYGKYRDEEYFTSQDVFDYWRCAACSTVFIHPVPRERLSEIYPSNYYSFQPHAASLVSRIKEKLDARYLRRILRSLPGERLAVLDIGGGTGWLLDLVRKLDTRIGFTQIVDLDPNAGAAAQSKGHAYACQRIEDFNSVQSFDLVLMLNLIEHVEAPRQVLARIASLLAPGGRVVIKTPNIDAADARIFRSTNWAGLHVPRHWTLFTRASFERMLGNTGLRIEQFSYTQGAPFWAASVLAAWQRRGWITLSQQRPVVYHPLFAPLAALFAALDFARSPWARTSQMNIVLSRSGT